MKIYFLIALLLCSFSAATEETIPQTLGNDFLAPAHDSYREYYLISAGSIIVGELFFQKLEKNFQKSVSTRKPLGSSSKYGDLLGQGIPNALYFLGMEAAGEGHLAGVMLRSTLVSGVTADVLKYTIREKRPDSNAKTSFPSGHTTMAFSFASVVQDRHGLTYGIPAYMMATFVGFSRINDNKHYFFDVAAGALIGTMYGLSISKRDRDLLADKNTISYDWIPSITHNELGINVLVSY